MEQAKLDADELRHWAMNESRMNYLLMSFFWRCFPYEWMEEVTGLEYQQPAKLAHWFIGILILIYLSDLAVRYLVRYRNCEVQKGAVPWDSIRIMASYVMIINMTLLLPVITIGLKSYNYDLFSAGFGALGGVCALIAFQEKSFSFGFKAVFFSTCSVLEKKTGIPILLAACTVLAAVSMLRRREGRWERVRAGLWYSLAGVFFYVSLIFINQFCVLEIIKKSHAPVHTLYSAMLTGIRALPVIYPLSSGISRPYVSVLTGCILLAALIFMAAVVLYGICVWYEKRETVLRPVSVRVACLLLTVFVLAGMMFILLRADYTENRVLYLRFIVKNYVLAMPSVLLLMSFALTFAYRHSGGRVSLLWSAVIVSLGITPAYLLEIRWNPTWMRYLNMFLCLYAVFITAAVLPAVCDWLAGRVLLPVVICAVSVLHMAEVIGSMPAFTYFCPWWYGMTAVSLPPEERVMDVYWGENRESLGLRVLEYCSENGLEDQPITIYYGYIRGEWITCPTNVTVAEKNWNETYENCSVTDYDFYALDTQSVVRGMVKDGWPEDVEPVITVTYRDYVIARIYQGSQLQEYLGK